MAMLVRDATAADGDAIGQIHVRAWRAAYSGGLMPDDYLEGLSVPERAKMWRHALMRDPLDRVSRLVVEGSEGVVVGFAVVGPRDNDPDAIDGELYVINVEPDSWGTGAGEALHNAAIGAMTDAGLDEAVLWVHPQNHRARRFYASHAWAVTGEERTQSVLGVEVPEVQYMIGLSADAYVPLSVVEYLAGWNRR